MRKKRWLCEFLVIFFLNLMFSLHAFPQASRTSVRGVVTDATTGETLPFVSVILENTTIGTVTDSIGRYSIVTTAPVYKIKFSFLGYEPASHIIYPGKSQTVNVSLKQSAISLNEVVVKPGKVNYSNRNNPAVDLIRNVIENKNINRKEGLDYLSYSRYEKVIFGLTNLTDEFKQSGLFRKFPFIFENEDTIKENGRSNVPMYMKERSSDLYYRKNPEASKEVVKGEKTINFGEYIDNRGVGASVDYFFQNINIYDNDIFFMTNKFLSPVASTAPVFYRYYIIDTSYVDSTKCFKMFFEPRNPADFLFHGYLYITADSSFAIKGIDMSFNKAINIDWVKDVRIVQDFSMTEEKSWMLSKDDINVDFAVIENAPGMFGHRTATYYNYSLNKPPADTVFAGMKTEWNVNAGNMPRQFWDSVRVPPLSRTEKMIYTIVDSVKKVPNFKYKMNLVMLLTTEFLTLGKFEIGPVGNFYSYNPIEGSRIRFGGRTTPEFNKWVYFEPFIAYGFDDRQFKYSLTATLSLTGTSIYKFPVNAIRFNYQYDTKIPGQELQFYTGDNLFLSLKRGVDDKLYYNRSYSFEYLSEFQNHFSYTLGYNFTKQTPAGALYFTYDDISTVPSLDISEVYLKLRYAPREEFYQGKIYRDPVPSKNPVFRFQYTLGSKELGSEYDYQKVWADINKRFYLSIVGYTDVGIEAGKIFGSVPYPLLFVHNANQTYAYQRYSYNMMNFLEFVSDQYVSLNIDHSFNGFFLNKIPGLKKLKLREVVTFKALYGGVSDKSNPELHSDLFRFPADGNGVPLTYTLEKKPYIEASIGFSNILRIFRVDLIKRFSYLDHPNVSGLGVRVQFRFDI